MPSLVLVTGASAGLGAAIARRFAAGHVRVVAAGRRADRLAALADELGRDLVLPLAFDVADRASIDAALGSLPSDWLAIDGLVNNAGLALGMGPAQSADPDDWDTMIATNCRGVAQLTRAVLPGMVERGRGHVITMGSVAGTYPYPGGNVYGATKAFVRQFSLDLRSDLHGTGLRVTCVEPGMVGGTEFSAIRFGGDEEKAAAVYSGFQPLSPEDIAETVWWTMAQPPHVNVNTIEIMPVAQSFAAFQVARGTGAA